MGMKARSEYSQLEDYFDTLRIRGVKELSIERYRSQMVGLIHACERIGAGSDISKWSEPDVHRALRTMRLAESSEVRYASTIKGIAKFLDNPKLENLVILSNGNRPNVKWITDEQFAELMTEPDLTDRLMIHLGGNLGMRVGEMAAFRISDIKPGYIIAHGKGHGDEGKTREIPLVEEKDPLIEEYLAYRAKLLEGAVDGTDGHVIVYRRHFAVRAYVSQGIGERIKHTMERHGIDATSHSLRREFITSALHAGCSVTDVMQIVGHTSPEITARYLRYDTDYLRNALRVRNQYISSNQSPSEEHEIRA